MKVLSEHKLFMSEYQVKHQLRFVNDWLFSDLDGEITNVNLWSNRFKAFMLRAGIKGQRLQTYTYI
mgnify:FL=1